MAWPKGRPRKPSTIAGGSAPQSEVQEEVAAMPKPEVLGTIKPPVPDDGSRWISPDGTVINLKETPPWALEAMKGPDKTDARMFVDYPKDWIVRWQSPRLIDQRGGYNGWLPLSTSDPRVTLKVSQMRDAGNLIRRGFGPQADILTFMPREWWEHKLRQKREAARKLQQTARNKQEQFQEDSRRGRFGKYVRATDDLSTPIATQFDGRQMRAAEAATTER